MTIGLRIDVDTLRGTRDGVPRLGEILARREVRGTWYFSVGPDNMGRHLRRMLRPAFAMKMLKSGAASLYGWDILLRGTLWPGPIIGDRSASTIREIVQEGHEPGLHAWDHHRWQVGVETLGRQGMATELRRAWEMLSEITGREPITAASPGWRCTDEILELKEDWPFAFNSDCRGPAVPFRPEVSGRVLGQVQVPVDLPTYDECAGRHGVDDAGWNAMLLERIADDQPHVLTIHAESEGGVKARLFESFLDEAMSRGHRFLPLGEWLAEQAPAVPGGMDRGEIPGREGWVATSVHREGIGGASS
ncbi:MAG: 4-deoxy-4-formamido-L-arabinose-phosphoundecaprenol deformylase [Phycisphaerales bacterium]|nr:4-deoxy-4-formamido-L-arabinose-phosphoundecaprenol deformylase [Phycisphaerales bacterium]